MFEAWRALVKPVLAAWAVCIVHHHHTPSGNFILGCGDMELVIERLLIRDREENVFLTIEKYLLDRIINIQVSTNSNSKNKTVNRSSAAIKIKTSKISRVARTSFGNGGHSAIYGKTFYNQTGSELAIFSKENLIGLIRIVDLNSEELDEKFDLTSSAGKLIIEAHKNSNSSDGILLTEKYVKKQKAVSVLHKTLVVFVLPLEVTKTLLEWPVSPPILRDPYAHLYINTIASEIKEFYAKEEILESLDLPKNSEYYKNNGEFYAGENADSQIKKPKLPTTYKMWLRWRKAYIFIKTTITKEDISDKDLIARIQIEIPDTNVKNPKTLNYVKVAGREGYLDNWGEFCKRTGISII